VASRWHHLAALDVDRFVPINHSRSLARLLLLMTVVTGLVDAVSYLALGRVFVANMTGNVVFLGFAWAGEKSLSAMASAAALEAFLAGAAVGGELAARRGGHRGRHLAAGSAISLVLLAVALVVAAVAPQPYIGVGRYALLGLLAVAMGVQNATARSLGVPDATTTVLTMTLTGLAADARLRTGANPRLVRRVVSLLAMLLGAGVGALLTLRVDPAWAVAGATALMLVVAVTTARLARGSAAADWMPAPAGAAPGAVR
jgi:uncharacterized membrane protein YoaK (UPF0700 family)